jgi:hypothetical protein
LEVFEVLPTKDPLGVYTALKGCDPRVRGLPPVLTCRLAVPVLPVPAATVWGAPMALAPSKNWTVPVGLTAPLLGVMTSLRVIVVPGTCGETGDGVKTLVVVWPDATVRLPKRQLPELLL